MTAHFKSGRIVDTLAAGPLREAFVAQAADVSTWVDGLGEEKTRITGILDVMSNFWQQAFGFNQTQADALVQLVGHQPPEGIFPTSVALADRLALQRALVVLQWHGDVAPYLRAAADGALSGITLSEDMIVSEHIASKGVANIPTLPPIHSQDASLSVASTKTSSTFMPAEER